MQVYIRLQKNLTLIIASCSNGALLATGSKLQIRISGTHPHATTICNKTRKLIGLYFIRDSQPMHRFPSTL